MIGKKPVMNEPAVGSPAKKRCRSPVTDFSVGSGEAAEDKPDKTVENVVQTSDQEESGSAHRK